MDVQRKRPKRRIWLQRSLLAVFVSGLLGLATYGLSRLETAVPTIEQSVLTATVERGTMIRDVSGHGRLVPIDITFVSAETGGRVESILVEPGMNVTVGMPLLELSNTQSERALTAAQRSLESTKDELRRYRLLLDKGKLDLRAATAAARVAWEEAADQAEMDVALAKKGLKSARERRLSTSRSEWKFELYELQLARVENSLESNKVQLKVKEDAVAHAEQMVADREHDIASLMIRATTDGILQQLGASATTRLEVGQQVYGTGVVALITDPTNLKAVLEVSEVQARDVSKGQTATIDTRSAVISGTVSRIAPAAQGGIVEIDVELTGELPRGARPDLSVNGTIEIERLDDVFFVGQPTYSRPDATMTLFKLNSDGLSAVRTTVEFGRMAVHTIEVRDGLQAGDRIIRSDMKRYDKFDRVMLSN